MTTPFGPQLVGMLEKTFAAILRQCLTGTGLTESEWVTLRLAAQQPPRSSEGLVATVHGLAQAEDAAEVVRRLHDRSMLENDHLTFAGQTVMAKVQAHISRATSGLWADLPAADIDAAERTLNSVLSRASARLETLE